MRAAHFVFFVGCISNISINSTANNAANVACIVIIIVILFTAAYITAISYIFNFTFLAISVICFTGNTTNISNINSFISYSIIMCTMITISTISIPTCRYVAAVFGVLYGSAFHIADNAADVVCTFNIQAVVNKVCAVADNRIYGMAN